MFHSYVSELSPCKFFGAPTFFCISSALQQNLQYITVRHITSKSGVKSLSVILIQYFTLHIILFMKSENIHSCDFKSNHTFLSSKLNLFSVRLSHVLYLRASRADAVFYIQIFCETVDQKLVTLFSILA